MLEHSSHRVCISGPYGFFTEGACKQLIQVKVGMSSLAHQPVGLHRQSWARHGWDLNKQLAAIIVTTQKHLKTHSDLLRNSEWTCICEANDTCTDRSKARQIEIQTHIQTNKKTGRQAGMPERTSESRAGMCVDRHADRQFGTQTDRQTDTHTCTDRQLHRQATAQTDN